MAAVNEAHVSTTSSTKRAKKNALKRRRTGKQTEPTPKKMKKDPESSVVALPDVRVSDKLPLRRTKWINKQRVLIFSSRGISFRARHMMRDLRTVMPHSRPDNKMDRKDQLLVINEICEMKNCNKCIYFEMKKKKDLYMWVANAPNGPSAKFLVENIHTMLELNMAGNCLKSSRPLLSFDESFEVLPYCELLKEVFVQLFGIPNQHPKSQPFVDHVFTFRVEDNRIWFRNYQILGDDGSLVEVGPRFVLNPIRIFCRSFGGLTLYQNPNYVSPNEHRRILRVAAAQKYKERSSGKIAREERRSEETYKLDPTDDVFQTV